MKKWITSAAIFAAAFFPQAAHAAEEGAPEHGSWTLLLFFAINFILFVTVLVRFAGPPLRKFFADRAASIRTALSRAASALAEAEDLANKADPGTQSWAGIALNPLRSPAGVVKQAEVSDRVQGMMVRQLERTWRTSENPAEREAAYAALTKMQGAQ